MRDIFPEYYPPDEHDFKELSANSLVVVDACVLLNLYSYSDALSAAVIQALVAVRDRLWMPHQFAFEYLRDRPAVILKEASNISGAIGKLEDILKDLQDLSKQPFVHETLLGQLKRVVDELRASEESQRRKVSADPYREKIAELLAGKVGTKPTEAETADRQQDAEKRIIQRVPPGFADVKKKGEAGAGGDAIAWLQVLDHLSVETRSLILVTDDGKEDWWTIVRDRTVGPRPECNRSAP